MSLGEPAGGVIHVTLQLPRELVESLGMHPLKGAMLCAVEARSQTPYCCNISKAKRVDTVEPVKKGRSCRFSLDVDLMKALQLPQWGGVYFLHASCMQYRSRVVAVRVGEESEKVRK